MYKPMLLILLSVILGVMGQFFFKAGMSHVGAVRFNIEIIRYFFIPQVFLGLVCYVLSTASWLAVLSKSDISFAYPMLSLGYILVVLVGLLFFKEKVTFLRFAGVLLICGGVFLTLRS